MAHTWVLVCENAVQNPQRLGSHNHILRDLEVCGSSPEYWWSTTSWGDNIA